MENLYGFHYTDDHCYSEEQSSMAPPPLPPSSNSVVSSMGAPILVPAGSSASDNAFLQQEQEQDDDEEVSKVLRAKVASHPLFPQLLNNYIDCHKVGAPPEMAQLLDEIREANVSASAFFGSDLELDNFMGTYCNLLAKYKYELLRPFEEATMFLNDMETQLNSIICNGPALIDEATAGSSEKGFITDEKETTECKRIDEDRELKDNLLRRYSGYISTLKNEFSKNKKKERLPNEAKQILLAWWNIHFKWPYPTDADKAALAEWTGLDQKQINNWFINQRKRHWKLPSDQEMQAAVLDGIYGPICMTESE